MAISQQTGDSNSLMRSYFHLSNLNRLFGKYHESLEFAQAGLKLAQQLSVTTDQVLQLQVTASQDYRAIGLNHAALDYQKEALQFALQTRVPLIISRAYVQLGRVHGLLHNFAEATINIERGFKIGEEKREERSGKDMMGYAILHLADFYRDLGNLDQSAINYNQAISLYSQTNLKHLLYQAYRGKILSALALKDYETIQADLPEFLKLFEQLRAQTLEEGNRNSLFDAEQNVCDALIDFAYSRMNNPQLALSYSETCRARSLLDLIGADPQILQDSSLPDLRISATARPVEPQQIREALPRNTQIVQYDVLEDKILIWVVSHDGISPVKVDISAKHLSEVVTSYLQLVSNPNNHNDGETRRQAVYLYDLLVKPIEPLLNKQKFTCVVPDKVLNYLPFNALISSDTGEYIAEKLPMVFAPSANVFLLLTNAARKRSQPRFERLLSVGNPHFNRTDFPSLPDLPPARKQAEQIIVYYPSKLLLTEERAREKQVKAEMERADVIHFATHYVTDDRSPMLSKLLLTKEDSDVTEIGDFDGVLQPFEIYRMKLLRARLVVLSACQTGVERYYRGEGMIGMARPFLAAEVPLVVASLWAVDADATKELMIRFHRNRKIRQISTVEALRQAQKEMLHHPISHYRNPYFWASFVVIGGYAEF
jgi:CHAT domain-containing protein